MQVMVYIAVNQLVVKKQGTKRIPPVSSLILLFANGGQGFLLPCAVYLLNNQTYMGILILVTGGTFDKEYNELTGELYFKETHLPEMLRLGRNLAETRTVTLEMIDSLYMTDTYRQALAAQCNEAKESNIIITHGTDTMAETAVYLDKAVTASGKTIVLTGAMVPYKFGSSDGLFNLGSAMAFVQTLPPGVYVAMNGSCFPAGRVRKNKATGLFEKIV